MPFPVSLNCSFDTKKNANTLTVGTMQFENGVTSNMIKWPS